MGKSCEFKSPQNDCVKSTLPHIEGFSKENQENVVENFENYIGVSDVKIPCEKICSSDNGCPLNKK